MALSYVEIIGLGFPAVQVHCIGDAYNYDNVVWDAGSPLPSKQTLDDWIIANPNASATSTQLTKFQFRKLFTFEERVAIDNAPNNTIIPEQYRAMVNTMLNDLHCVDYVDLSHSDTIQAVQRLETFGLIGSGRAVQVLANQLPTN